MKDYANQQRPSRSKKNYAQQRHVRNNRKSLIAIISLIVAALVIVTIAETKSKPTSKPKTHKLKLSIKKEKKKTKTNTAVSTKHKSSTSNTPKLDFYTMLAHASVQTTSLKPAITTKQIKYDSNATYQLQVAAGTQLNAIKKLHQQLEELGYAAYITQFINNGTTWYRLQLGPFASRSSAKNNQKTLSTLNFPSIIQKIR